MTAAAAAAAAQPIVVRDKLVRDLWGTRDNLLTLTFDIFVSKKGNFGLANVCVDASRVQYVCCHICSFCLHSTTTTMEKTYQLILQQFAAPSQFGALAASLVLQQAGSQSTI